jgi:uncharacterized protein YbjT (DUF2867 family)
MIFVSGASGTVGSEVVRLLSAAGARVRVGLRSPEKAVKLPGVEVVPFDFTDPVRVRSALRGVERAFLLTATGPSQAELESSFAEEAVRAGVRHIVKLSVWRAADAGYTFARVHRAAERKIEALRVPFTFLRPNSFMQNLLHSATTVKEERAIFQPAGEAKVSMIDTRDVARVAVKVLGSDDHFGAAYDLSGPSAVDYAEVAETIGTAVARQVRFVDVPPASFRHGLGAEGVSSWTVEAILDLQSYASAGGASGVVDTVRRITGAQPTTLERFVRDHVEVFT